MNWKENIFSRKRAERELDEELCFHVERRSEELRRAGLSWAEARRRARVELGGAEQIKEEVRAMRPGIWLETLWQDVRYAARQLRKTPGLTAVAVLTLALGIGANTTVFGWARALLLEPLPGVPNQREIAVMVETNKTGRANSLSYPNYLDFRAQADTLAGLIVFQTERMALESTGAPEMVWCTMASENFFEVLQVRPALGRGFLPGEGTVVNGHPVAVLSHSLWQRHFGGDRAVIGRSITLNRVPLTVVGVMPENFLGSYAGLAPAMWVPMMMRPALTGMEGALEGRGWHSLDALARVKPGVSRQQAQANLQTVAARLAAQYPDTNQGDSAALYPMWNSPWGAGEILLPVITVLAVVAALVLLIACANLANLLVVRSMGRQREIAVRLSMGAGRWRIVRQLLTETALLSLLAGGAALAANLWTRDLLMALVPVSNMPFRMIQPFDAQLLSVAFLLAVGAGTLFALLPAWQASAPNPASSLRETSGALGGSRARARMRNVLVGAQVAICFLLLAGAGLFLRGLHAAQRVDPGFRPDGLTLASINLHPHGYTPAQATAFLEQVRERLAATPGVESAAAADWVPLGFSTGSSNGATLEGYEPKPDEIMGLRRTLITPAYFRTLQHPLVAGREFAATDSDEATPVIIVNEALVRRYWPGQDARGKHIRMMGKNHEVVGIARDSKYSKLDEAPVPYVYLPLTQHHYPELFLHVRAGAGAVNFDVLRGAVMAVDPNVAVYDITTMREFMGAALFVPRTAAWLLGVVGAIGLLLALVGIYGVVSYSVSQRTREFGLRMALGARPAQVLQLVLRHALFLLLIGAAIGAVGALAASRLLEGMLYGVSPRDAFTFVVVFLALAVASLLACAVPAWRAVRVDPATALRQE